MVGYCCLLLQLVNGGCVLGSQIVDFYKKAKRNSLKRSRCSILYFDTGEGGIFKFNCVWFLLGFLNLSRNYFMKVSPFCTRNILTTDVYTATAWCQFYSCFVQLCKVYLPGIKKCFVLSQTIFSCFALKLFISYLMKV